MKAYTRKSIQDIGKQKAEAAFFVLKEVYKYLQENKLYDTYKSAYLKYVDEVMSMINYLILGSKTLQYKKHKFLQTIDI